MWFSSDFWTYLITIFIIFSVLGKCLEVVFAFRATTACDKMQIIEVVNEERCTIACDLLKRECESLSALGFDCEWVCSDGIQRPVALLQLASASGYCCLFRLNKLKQIPTKLEELLSDPNIIKAGVCPLNDAFLLLKDYGIQVCSTLDLRHLYPKATGLASLARSVLFVELDKNWRIRCSDWESLQLTDYQKNYAAKDAFVAIEVLKKWLRDKESIIDKLNRKLKSELERYLDIPYQTILKKAAKGYEGEAVIPEGMINYSLRNEQRIISGARKSPLYDNCFMNAPDGTLLCSCDKKKAEWYVNKGLAEVLPGEPYTIQLLFEPAGRSDEDSNGQFYRQLKQNCCVVCGASESYLRHNVVPKEYRKHFPHSMKDHQSHDIVLMCVKCHYLAGQHNENLRKRLALSCNAPIQGGRETEDRVIKRIRNCAKALLAAERNIPQKRKLELENEIKEFFQMNAITSGLLDKASNLELKIANDKNNTHGIRVVNYYKTSGGGLKNLELLWREHFLKTMRPKYLPTFWSTTHNHSKLIFQ